MAKVKVLAGDYPKGAVDFDAVSIIFRKTQNNLPKQLYYIDVETYAEGNDGTLELRTFGGHRILLERNPAFLKVLKVALFDEPQDPSVRRQRWEERQRKGGTKVKRPLTGKKIMSWLFIGFVGLLILGHCSSSKDTAVGQYVAQSQEKQKQRAIDKAPSKIADGVMDFKYTKQGYPKLYKQWGESGVKKINELLPKAAIMAAKEKSCDRVESVDISSRSTKGNIIFFADCTNKKRFFISENDIKTQAAVTAEQDKEIDNMRAINVCDDAIKAHLNHPGTFNPHVTDTGTAINPNGNIIVTRGFTAKNGLGMEIDYRARCVLTHDYKLNPKDLRVEQK